MSLTVTEQRIELVLPSRIEAIADVAQAAAKFIGQLGLGEEFAFGVDMAVREAVTNAVLHGNKQEVEKTVEVTLWNRAGALEITVRDHGEGFDPGSVPDPTEAQNLMKSSGRGILFMRTFMDEVEWSHHAEGGTVVRMIKRH
ncbi:MAG TPA: ATP-binding protein [Pyrinomonadaceae bacterium]|jgi:serine/threonine-protein kinase RsbW|nr:ATP-binding protein [Pyrinomonadaceae bacterium]